MNGRYCSLSPDGQYFGYHYEVYTTNIYDSIGVISKVPNFTALYIQPNFGGMWNAVCFEEDGSVIDRNSKWEKKSDIDLRFVTGDIRKAPSGFIETNLWVDPKGRMIRFEGAKIFADDQLLYDTTDHVFVERKPI